MKNFNKKKESVVLEANGVDKERFLCQFNDKAPHIRLYERKKRGDKVIHKKIGEFYTMKRSVQRSWSLSQDKGE